MTAQGQTHTHCHDDWGRLQNQRYISTMMTSGIHWKSTIQDGTHMRWTTGVIGFDLSYQILWPLGLNMDLHSRILRHNPPSSYLSLTARSRCSSHPQRLALYHHPWEWQQGHLQQRNMLQKSLRRLSFLVGKSDQPQYPMRILHGDGLPTPVENVQYQGSSGVW